MMHEPHGKSQTVTPIVSVARGIAPPRPVPPIELEHTDCPLCDADDVEPLFDGSDYNFGFAGQFPVVRCRRCDLVYNNPRVPPTQIEHFFDSDYAAHRHDRGRSRPARSRRASDASERVAPFGRARLLDVGCGGGNYLERMRAAGWDVFGVDPVARAIDVCHSRGLPAERGTIPGVDLADRRFELITLLGVVGTLPRPCDTLETLRRHAAPDARLIATAFNANGLMARWAGPYWVGYDLPRECCHYTPRTLTRLLERTGWRVERLTFRRRPTIARRSARVRALATASICWRLAASQRWLTSLISTAGVRLRSADEICVVARPA